LRKSSRIEDGGWGIENTAIKGGDKDENREEKQQGISPSPILHPRNNK